jgi:hypothetical protein
LLLASTWKTWRGMKTWCLALSIQQSVKVIGDTPLEPDRLHRIRVMLCGATPERVAAMENLPIEVVEKIARRMEVHASRRERRLQDTVGTDG